MPEGKIKLDVKVLGEELFDALVNSEYMKEQGYRILYSQDCETKRETVKKDGLEYETEKITKKKNYTILYEGGYKRFEGVPHIEIYNIKSRKKISKLKFWVSAVSSRLPSVMLDLENLVEELNQRFSKKQL